METEPLSDSNWRSEEPTSPANDTMCGLHNLAVELKAAGASQAHLITLENAQKEIWRMRKRIREHLHSAPSTFDNMHNR